MSRSSVVVRHGRMCIETRGQRFDLVRYLREGILDPVDPPGEKHNVRVAGIKIKVLRSLGSVVSTLVDRVRYSLMEILHGRSLRSTRRP